MNLRRSATGGACTTLWILLSALVVHPILGFPDDVSQPCGRFPLASAAASASSQYLSDVSALNDHVATVYPLGSDANSEASSISLSDKVSSIPSPIGGQNALASIQRSTHLEDKKRTFILLLGVVTGIAHVVCANQYEYYANMMTGNTIRLATAVSKGDAKQGWYFGTLVLSYGIGASLFGAVEAFGPSDTSNGAIQDDRDEQSSPVLRRMAPVSFGVFAASDIVARTLPAPYRLHCLAVGFGMINAATQNVLGTVTNAATGHITRVGTGMVDVAALCLARRRGLPPPNRIISSVSSTILSARFVICLLLSIVGASKIYRLVLVQPWLEFLPPMGTTFGVLYAALLSWYTTSCSR